MRGHRGYRGIHNRQTPQGMTGTWEQSEGDKGGLTDMGNGGRRKHEAKGAESSGGGWRVAGVDDVQVDVYSHR